MAAIVSERTILDVAESGTRAVNSVLLSPDAPRAVTLANPRGAHALACGLDRDMDVTIDGHVGYYCAGMNQRATVTVNGSAGVGVAENMMSGAVRVRGDASQSAGATAHGGGLLVIEGNAGARCGISMKGVDIVVGGNIGHMGAFMGQAGRLVVCGNAGEALGDSLYEARLYVRGTVASLGADCIRKPMRPEHLAELSALLEAAGITADPADFTRYGSARELYHFHVDNARAY
ncbi:protein glxC [Nocardia crassostreae]|uniref:protein glxC n=1 Tax=Nocardia crassostreae TaxID=53428 RepID=UPI0008358D4C|nr:protein glxC [Nocardia crassostreae]